MQLIYWVCTAKEADRAIGHVSVCKACRAPGKPSRRKGHRMTWIGPFAEKHLALEAASATGRRFDWCCRCRNFTGELRAGCRRLGPQNIFTARSRGWRPTGIRVISPPGGEETPVLELARERTTARSSEI